MLVRITATLCALTQLIIAIPAIASSLSPKPSQPAKQLIAANTKATTLPLWSRHLKVPFRSWIPAERPTQVILCVHGLGFSSESFSEFGRVMAGHGVAVYALDVRGFGEWMARTQGNTVNFEGCLSDIEAALRTLHKTFPGVPVFLVGESMGGAIALAETSRNPDLVNGLISSVPSSDRYAKLTSEIIVGAHFLKDKNKPMDITPEVINRTTANPALRKKWEAEPLNRTKLSPKELKQFEDFMKGNNDAAALIEKVPVLMVAGFKDKLVKPEGTIELFNNISNQDKLLLVVGDGEHLLLEENQLTEQLENLLLVWIRNESHGQPKGINAHP
jgi:acylglycerol lipase